MLFFSAFIGIDAIVSEKDPQSQKVALEVFFLHIHCFLGVLIIPELIRIKTLEKTWDFAILRGRQGCPKKTRGDVLQATSGGKISNFKTFVTTDSIGSLCEKTEIHVKTCVTLKISQKSFFENDGIRKECNGWPL